MSSTNTPDQVVFADIYNGSDDSEHNLSVAFADKFLKVDAVLGVIYKSINELKQEGTKIMGFNMDSGKKEDWAYPLDTSTLLAPELQISQIQRDFINKLFTRNNSEYEDTYGDLITVENRINYLINGSYNRQYCVTSTLNDDEKQSRYLNSATITIGDGNTRTIPYFHPNLEKPFNVSRNLGHIGPNFAIDGVLTCDDKIILIIRRPRDAKGSVTSRSGSGRSITSLIGAGTPASAAFAGGMLETSAGMFCLIKEMMEEAGLTPEDLFGERCPTLLKTANWARKNDDGTFMTMAQVLATLPEDKRDDAEYAFSQWLNPDSFLYQTTIFGASIKNSDLNPTGIKSGDLLRVGNYELLAQLITPSINDFDGYDLTSDHATLNSAAKKLVENAMQFLLNGSDIAFDLQIMESDPRNSSIAFMVSCGLRIEITPETYQKLTDIYNPATPNENSVSNSESAGLCVVSARELAAYYDNPELYLGALTAVDCDKNATLEVTNLFTDSRIPVWRTHLDTLIKVAHNVVDKIDYPEKYIESANIGQCTAREITVFSRITDALSNFARRFTFSKSR